MIAKRKIDQVTTFVKDNIGSIAIGTSAAIGGAVVGTAAGYAIGKSKSRKRRKSSSRTRKGKRRKSKRNKRKYYPERKGMKYSRRKIRRTKNGQPYIILASGKARFIKKSSARTARRRKGGRY